jgi:hypothetical protein
VTAIAIAVLCLVGGVAMAKMAITGRPRLIWGRSGANYFTRAEQVAVCSFESIVLLFAAVIKLSASLPPSKLVSVLSRMNQAIAPVTLIFLFLSVVPLVWGISGLSRDTSDRSTLERLITVAATLVGAILLVMNLFQVIIGLRSSL